MEQTIIDHIESRAIERKELQEFKDRVLGQMPALASALQGEPEATSGQSAILAAAQVIQRLKKERQAGAIAAAAAG